MWYDSYSTLGGTDSVLPVDYYIPGCPPRPEAILFGVAVALGLVPKQVAPKVLEQKLAKEFLPAELRHVEPPTPTA